MKAVLNKVNGLTLKNKVAIVTIPFITYLAVRVVIEAITNGTSI